MKWEAIGGVGCKLQLGRGRRMEERGVESFQIRHQAVVDGSQIP
jgi:hypothetical protein